MVAKTSLLEVWDGGDPVTFNVEHIMFFEKVDIGETFVKLKDGSFKLLDIPYETFKELYNEVNFQ